MTNETKYAFCLSGGGMKGIWEVGAIEVLYQAGIQPSFIAGTSVGALNGSLLAQHKLPQLLDYWQQVELNGYSEIWDSWLVKEVAGSLKGKMGGIMEVLFTSKLSKLTGLGTLRPLLEKLRMVVKKEDFKIPFRCGVTSLTSGSYHSIDPDKCANTEEIIRAILASATMPIIWEPVPFLTTSEGEFGQLVDGGVQSITPIKEAIDYINEQPDTENWELIIIQCSTDQLEPHPEPYALIGIAGRTMDLLLNRVFQADVEHFMTINKLIQLSGTNRLGKYRYIPNLIIQPSKSLGSTLNSSAEVLRFRQDLGQQDTIRALKTYLHS